MINLKTSAKSKLFFSYSILFLITVSMCFVPLLISGRTFVAAQNGFNENLSAFSYFLSKLKSFSFAQYDFSLGLGKSAVPLVQSFGLCDPLNLLGVFFPKTSLFFLYSLLFFVRLFLCGLSFLIYSKYRKFDEFTSILGALIYTFSGIPLIFGVQNQAFLSAMIYLPLLCFGIERILACKRPFVFTTFIFLSSISNFQFFLPLALFSILYFLIRFFFVIEKENHWQFYRYFLVFAFGLVLGIALGGYALMPHFFSTVANFDTDRLKDVSPLYTPLYYFKFLLSLFSLSEFGTTGATGFSPLFLIILIFVLLKNEIVMKPIKLYLAIGAIFFAFPCFAFLFSSLQSVSNIWSFAFSFTAAILTARFIPNFYTAEKKIYRVPLLVLIVLSLCALAYSFFNPEFAAEYTAPFALLLLSSALLAFAYTFKKETKLLFASIALISLAINANARFFAHKADFMTIEQSKRFAFENAEDFPAEIEAELSSDFFRIETSNLENKDFAQTSKYRFFGTKNARNENQSISSPELSLLSVKYFFEPRKQKIQLPFGFSNHALRTLNYNFLESDYFLPFGFTFKKVVPKSLFQKLNLVQQRSALLDYAVLDDEIFGENYEFKNEFDFSSVQQLETTISSDNGLDYENTRIAVRGDNAKLYMKINASRNTEKWLYVKNLQESGDNDEISIVVNTPERTHTISKTGDILINISCLDENDFVISFVFENGEYTFDEISVHEFSFNDFGQRIALLKENHLENVKMEKSSISGKISVEKQELLYLSIPFEPGWKALDNGKEAEILKVNDDFSSILLEKGSHEILLSYETPGLKIGRTVTKIALGIVLLTLLILFIRARISQRGLIARIWHKLKMLSIRKLVK